METSVAVKQETNLAKVEQQAALESAGLSNAHAQISSIFVVNSNSELVKQRKASYMDIVLSSDSIEVIGNDKTPVELIPLYLVENWRVMDLTSGVATYVRTEPFIRNQKPAWEFMENGKPMRRDFTQTFYVLIRKNGQIVSNFPSRVSFSRSNLGAGKKMASFMWGLAMGKKATYSHSVLIGSTEEKQKDGPNTYAVFTFERGKEVSAEEQAVAANFLELVRGLKHEEAVKTEAQVATPAVEPVVLGKDDDIKF